LIAPVGTGLQEANCEVEIVHPLIWSSAAVGVSRPLKYHRTACQGSPIIVFEISVFEVFIPLPLPTYHSVLVRRLPYPLNVHRAKRIACSTTLLASFDSVRTRHKLSTVDRIFGQIPAESDRCILVFKVEQKRRAGNTQPHWLIIRKPQRKTRTSCRLQYLPSHQRNGFIPRVASVERGASKRQRPV
jgi:hypothetical protein